MRQNYFIYYLALVVAQMLICNYFNLTPYLMLTVLPAAVLCLPTRIGTPLAMVIAFATGLCVDFLAEGVPGLNTLALVPVAWVRLPLCKFIFGEELVVRGEDFSIRKHGIGKVTFACVLVQALFLLVYLWADGAAARPFLFLVERFACSLVAGTALAVAIVDIAKPVDRR